MHFIFIHYSQALIISLLILYSEKRNLEDLKNHLIIGEHPVTSQIACKKGKIVPKEEIKKLKPKKRNDRVPFVAT